MMQLRNKKTGQEGNFIINKDHFECVDLEYVPEYRNLAELNAEWEDYEDELFYVISAEHKGGYQCVLKEEYPEIIKVAKELGIGFDTEKECQKAVEKLKAWKRLKDKGFMFESWWGGSKDISFWVDTEIDEDVADDLDLLFGGEE